jgi:SsrA-binding protein
MKIIARNKKATYNYFVETKFEAGIVLKGTEIKSIRANKVSIQDSYVRIKNEEAFIINMHIAKYKEGNIFNHEETRTRKLLLHKKEIIKLSNALNIERKTIIPVSVYLKEGLAKIEIAIATGKKLYDKRQSLKEKDQTKRMQKNIKQHLS